MMHGGKTPRGPALPQYKHGNRSLFLKELKGDLRAGFQRARKDAELKGLREHSDLLDGFIIEQLKKLGQEKMPPWGDAVEALNDWKTAKSDEAKEEAFKVLEKIIRQGAAANKLQTTIRREVRELIQEQTRMLGAEWKRISP